MQIFLSYEISRRKLSFSSHSEMDDRIWLYFNLNNSDMNLIESEFLRVCWALFSIAICSECQALCEMFPFVLPFYCLTSLMQVSLLCSSIWTELNPYQVSPFFAWSYLNVFNYMSVWNFISFSAPAKKSLQSICIIVGFLKILCMLSLSAGSPYSTSSPILHCQSEGLWVENCCKRCKLILNVSGAKNLFSLKKNTGKEVLAFSRLIFGWFFFFSSFFLVGWFLSSLLSSFSNRICCCLNCCNAEVYTSEWSCTSFGMS